MTPTRPHASARPTRVNVIDRVNPAVSYTSVGMNVDRMFSNNRIFVVESTSRSGVRGVLFVVPGTAGVLVAFVDVAVDVAVLVAVLEAVEVADVEVLFVEVPFVEVAFIEEAVVGRPFVVVDNEVDALVIWKYGFPRSCRTREFSERTRSKNSLTLDAQEVVEVALPGSAAKATEELKTINIPRKTPIYLVIFVIMFAFIQVLTQNFGFYDNFMKTILKPYEKAYFV